MQTSLDTLTGIAPALNDDELTRAAGGLFIADDLIIFGLGVVGGIAVGIAIAVCLS